MRIAQQETAVAAFHAHAGQSCQQRDLIVQFIRTRGGDWSIGEIAQATGLQKSTVSGRVNELVNDTHQLIERPRRKDRVSGVTVRPVSLPIIGQGALF